MGVYHQIGHQSDNLVRDPSLVGYSGVVLSPVNYSSDEMSAQVQQFRGLREMSVVFDPQLYFPRNSRVKLESWSYFPSDVDTADLSRLDWWEPLADGVVQSAVSVDADVVAAPAVAPRTFSSNYYSLMAQVARRTQSFASDAGMDAAMTVVVNLADLADAARPMEVASLMSQSGCDRAYVLVANDVVGRRELTDQAGLTGVTRLVQVLEDAGIRCLIGYASSDVVLWKAAGAQDCASGKFWNLRRFTPSRWQEVEGEREGGPVAYWFDSGTHAFLREVDVLRLRSAGLLDSVNDGNPFGRRILANLDSSSPRAWVGLGWRQFLHWFMTAEGAFDGGMDFDDFLSLKEDRWEQIEDANILMDERRNDGRWLRGWRQVVRSLR